MSSTQKFMEQKLKADRALVERWDSRFKLSKIKGRTVEEKLAKQSMVAKLMENQMIAMEYMKEATTTGSIGQFSKYALPLIRRIYPTLPINDLVGIQPLTGPSGLIFTLEAKYGSNKSPITAGSTIYNNASSSYASKIIDGEVLQAAGGATVAYAGTLKWTAVIPGSVVITVNTLVFTDNGLGVISGTGLTSGTIDYTTGEVVLTLAATNTAAATVVYQYNSEVNTLIPEVDLDISSQSVTAVARKLRAKWSQRIILRKRG